MKVLIIGKSGQVSTAIAHAAKSFPNLEIITLGRPDIDLLVVDGLAEKVAALEPEFVINPAAYTAVDKAEIEQDAAHQINAIAAGEIASGAAACGAPILHVSTDYVFDGRLQRSYRETDSTGPIGVYGHTKLAGEHLVAQNNDQHIIARTAWVYSPYGNNFVKTMLRIGATSDMLKVVDDQIGSPTSANDLAHAFLETLDRLLVDPSLMKPGIYNYTGSGIASWCDLAREVFDAAAELGFNSPTVNAITTDEYQTPAARPSNSRLDCSKLRSHFGIQLPYWRDTVRSTVGTLLNEQ